MKTLASRAAIGLLVLASACGDDHKSGTGDDGDSATPGAGKDGAISVVRPDAGFDMDAKVGPDGALLPADGAVAEDDGGSDETGDSAVADAGKGIDAAVPDAASNDAATPPVIDASVPDAASTVPDATTPDAATPPDASMTGDAGPCSINDPRYGCGSAISPTWIRFDNGLEVDRTTGLGWTPVRDVVSDTENEQYCRALTFAGITGPWDAPEIDQVRSLAAGCAATVVGGSCQVTEMLVLPDAGSDCSCAAGSAPPRADGFCRPEISSCETIWTRTFCGPNGPVCPTYQHWFYDVTTGAISLRPYGSEPANVKGRCVSKLVPPIP